jgi:hypothetical protein
MRLPTKMNENYNSNSNFYEESKYEVRLSIKSTRECIINCERILFSRRLGYAYKVTNNVHETNQKARNNTFIPFKQ